MSNELTEAERAVAALFADDCIHERGERCTECDARGKYIVSVARPFIAAETLNTHADRLDNLPPGGESLRGDVWYRDGLRDAAHLARDEAEEFRNKS